MSHTARISAQLVIGEWSVTVPDALTFRETREPLPPVEEWQKEKRPSKNLYWSRSSEAGSLAAGGAQEEGSDA